MSPCILKINYQRKDSADVSTVGLVITNPTSASAKRPSGSITPGIRISGTTGGVSKNRHSSHNISTHLQLFSYLLTGTTDKITYYI